MNNYIKYKEWWFENHGPADLNEEAFQEHINSLSTYQLLEALQMFKDEGTHPQEGWGDWQKRTTPVQSRKQTCSKCGMAFENLTGYVCFHLDCPTFMKVTC